MGSMQTLFGTSLSKNETFNKVMQCLTKCIKCKYCMQKKRVRTARECLSLEGKCISKQWEPAVFRKGGIDSAETEKHFNCSQALNTSVDR